MHPGKSGGSADGLVGGIMRRVLQLRTSEDLGNDRRLGVKGESPIEGANRNIRFREPQIEMAHGAGGKASRRLVEGLFAPLLFESCGTPLDDAARIDINGTSLALTTDSFVVK